MNSTCRRVDPLAGLLAATARGDVVAYAHLYAELRPRVEGLALRVVRDPDHAQEVAQEVLAEIWRTAGRFDAERGSTLGWAMTMTHRRAVDRVRAEASRRRRDAAYGIRSVSVPFDETEVAGTSRMECLSVRAAVSTLTPLQRQAIDLAFYGGLSHVQVARQLDVPVGTIKSRIHDGLRRMRAALPELAPEAA